MIKDKTIIIDLDSTILDTSFTIVNLYNKLNPDNQLSYTHNHSWGFEPIIKTKEELSNLFKLFDHEDFYKDVIVFPNAIKIINELAENNSVVICSKHSPSRIPITTKWINKVMPKVEIRFVDNFEDKGKLFDKVNYIIDDRVDTLDSFSEETTCILFGFYDWNKDCDDYHR
jgi:5'(3')-deoxyribonucleotidase